MRLEKIYTYIDTFIEGEDKRVYVDRQYLCIEKNDKTLQYDVWQYFDCRRGAINLLDILSRKDRSAAKLNSWFQHLRYRIVKKNLQKLKYSCLINEKLISQLVFDKTDNYYILKKWLEQDIVQYAQIFKNTESLFELLFLLKQILAQNQKLIQEFKHRLALEHKIKALKNAALRELQKIAGQKTNPIILSEEDIEAFGTIYLRLRTKDQSFLQSIFKTYIEI